MSRSSAACDWCGTPLAGQPGSPSSEANLCAECHEDYLNDTAMREIRHNEDLPE